MSLRELNSLAPWRWDRSKNPVGDASLRDFEEVGRAHSWGSHLCCGGARTALAPRSAALERLGNSTTRHPHRTATPQVNRIIPSLLKGNVDALTAAEELASHVSGARGGRLSPRAAPCCALHFCAGPPATGPRPLRTPAAVACLHVGGTCTLNETAGAGRQHTAGAPRSPPVRARRSTTQHPAARHTYPGLPLVPAPPPGPHQAPPRQGGRAAAAAARRRDAGHRLQGPAAGAWQGRPQAAPAARLRL